jgi:hypothetical protein
LRIFPVSLGLLLGLPLGLLLVPLALPVPLPLAGSFNAGKRADEVAPTVVVPPP